jgi:hypothetical protein
MHIVDDGAATQIEQVFAVPAVASAPPLPMSSMGQAVLDGDSFPQLGSSGNCQLVLAQFSQERFIGMNADTTPSRRYPLRSRTTIKEMDLLQLLEVRWHLAHTY